MKSIPPIKKYAYIIRLFLHDLINFSLNVNSPASSYSWQMGKTILKRIKHNKFTNKEQNSPNKSISTKIQCNHIPHLNHSVYSKYHEEL